MVLSSDHPHERTMRCSLSAETKIELALMTVLGALENVSLAWHTGCAKKKTAAQTGGVRNKVISFLQSQGREEVFSCFDKPDQSITHNTNGQLF
jgi:hypothetical protein